MKLTSFILASILASAPAMADDFRANLDVSVESYSAAGAFISGNSRTSNGTVGVFANNTANLKGNLTKNRGLSVTTGVRGNVGTRSNFVGKSPKVETFATTFGEASGKFGAGFGND